MPLRHVDHAGPGGQTRPAEAHAAATLGALANGGGGSEQASAPADSEVAGGEQDAEEAAAAELTRALSAESAVGTSSDALLSPVLTAFAQQVVAAGSAPPPVPGSGGDGAAERAMPDTWLQEAIPRSVWESMGLDVAPFCVQAAAPMHLVHFYFSQLTLNAVFVVDEGRFVGIITKADMHNSRF